MTTTAPESTARVSRRTRRKADASVLFDAPGPRARFRNNIVTGIAVLVFLALLYVVLRRFDDKGQFEGKLWKPFVKVETWTDYIIPGLGGTLKAAALAAVLALLFGVFFGLGRMSDHVWVRVPCAAVVEFFRAIPLLLLIFFIFQGPATIANGLGREAPHISEFTAVVGGLMLYNGSVLAEIFRSGIQSLPRGQSEAAYALGLRKSGVMRLILVPQAVTVMLPAIISQLVVLLKDSALGYIIAYDELLNEGLRALPGKYGNLIPAAIVIAVIYILMNLALGRLATYLEGRSRRSKKSAGARLAPDAPSTPGMGMDQGPAAN
ncbi:amino acid ABC transporter permease [Actinomadura rupiterrae]|uniref:amino acid ABC transporter permease n=1 Tax=Actinomadura rupiterrae TaxID=559627 RepID=UPI0020A337AA|nr:amino acid ABC transporter permease [Actinomadura rupiterrae]MCP2338833.1 glutamate transport system permease protein [Actinomadura rupiterrae]